MTSKHTITINYPSKVSCPNCNGEGKIRPPKDWLRDIMLIPFTLGLSLFVGIAAEKKKCKICDGKGYLKINEILQ